MFNWVPAAGGIIQGGWQDPMIFRRNVWDLPKGKLDDNENQEQRLSECEEETGLQNLDLISKLKNTFSYLPRQRKQKRVLKNFPVHPECAYARSDQSSN